MVWIVRNTRNRVQHHTKTGDMGRVYGSTKKDRKSNAVLQPVLLGRTGQSVIGWFA